MRLLQVGEVIRGRYEVLAHAGAGAMGVVYRARNLQSGTVHALKTLDLDAVPPAEVDEARALFEREARFLFSLDHAGFPRMTDYFVEESLCCQVMEMIDGETLEERVEREGAMSLREVVDITRQLAQHLRFLHEHPSGPFVYRDLKPSNVMLDGAGTVFLVDFGICRLYKPEELRDTQFLGTLGYAAPELFHGQQSSPASDMYALGGTVAFMLKAEHPLPAGAPQSPLPPSTPVVSRLVEHCLSGRSDKRPSALQVVEVLEDTEMDERWGPAPWLLLRAAATSLLRLPRKPWLHPTAFDGWLAMIVAVALTFVPQMLAQREARLEAASCARNLRVVARALDRYQQDHHGFPSALNALVPAYLRVVPVCPATQTDTYSRAFASSKTQNAYTLVCAGSNHASQAANHPQYTSSAGLREQPRR